MPSKPFCTVCGWRWSYHTEAIEAARSRGETPETGEPCACPGYQSAAAEPVEAGATPRIHTAEEAKTLREGATPGPWVAGRTVRGPCVFPAEGAAVDCPIADLDPLRAEGDAKLMAAAPDLAATVEHLHGKLNAARADVEAWKRAESMLVTAARLNDVAGGEG